MMAQRVCAVIVLFHPSTEMIENLQNIRKQVDALVAVDNGSTSAELGPVREVKDSLNFQLIENGENLGIADALNQGVRWAKSEGYDWVILFDQDSKITNGFIGQMFATWESHPERGRVGSMHPRYVDPDSGIEPVVRRANDSGPIISLTSGALMPLWIFDKIGGFASEFFIDWVDIEFSFRIRAAGFLIADSRQAVLLHGAGHPTKLSLFGFTFRPDHHNAARRYYISRNQVVVFRKYFRVFPLWIVQSMYTSLRETTKCFIGEQDRLHKFRNFLLGTWDGLLGRMGRRENL